MRNSIFPSIALILPAALWLSVAGCDSGDLKFGGDDFRDGTDDDTTYTAGPGLTETSEEFSVDFAGTGSADTVARSDHDHDSRYVLKAGDTMTGLLTLSGAPTANLHAATKAYADTKATTSQLNDSSSSTAPVGWRDLVTRPVAGFSGGNQALTLSGSVQTLRSVTLTVPSSGKVIVNASCAVNFTSSARDTIQASITTGTSVESSHLVVATDFGDTATSSSAGHMGGTRGFSVAAGTRTFRFVAQTFSGTSEVYDSEITAVFIPD